MAKVGEISVVPNEPDDTSSDTSSTPDQGIGIVSPAEAATSKAPKDPNDMTADEIREELKSYDTAKSAGYPSSNPIYGSVRGDAPPTLKDPSEMTADEIRAELYGKTEEPGQTQKLTEGLQKKAQNMADVALTGGKDTQGQALAASIANTSTFNLARNAKALYDSYRYGSTFPEEYKREKDYDEALARLNPGTSTFGNVVGGLTTMPFAPSFGLGKAGLMASEAVPGLVKSGLSAAGQSGIYGLISGAAGEHSLQGAMHEGLTGAATGAVLGPIVNKALTTAASRSLYRPTDSAGNLSAMAQKAISDAGIDVANAPPALMQGIIANFQKKGISPAAAREAAAGEFGIPLTRGQALADPNTISGENKLPTKGPVGEFKAVTQPAAVGASRESLMGLGAPANEFQAAADTIQNVQSAARSAKGAAQGAYASAYAMPGIFDANAVKAIKTGIEQKMLNNGDIVDKSLDPASTSALKLIDDQLGNLGIKNQLGNNPTPAQMQNVVGVNMQGVEQVRKNLASLARKAAPGSDDKRLMGKIIGHFDDHVEGMVQNGMFAGDPNALPTLQSARQQWRNYKQTFGVQGRGDSAGTIMDKIVKGNMNPAHLASYFMNDTQVGTRQVAPDLYDRLESALGAGTPEMKTINDALKAKLIEPNPRFDNNPTKQAQEVSKRIDQFLDRRGSVLANKAFTPAEQDQLRRYSAALQNVGRAGKTDIAAKEHGEAGQAAFGTAATVGPMLAAAHFFPGFETIAGFAGHHLAEPIREMLSRASTRKASQTAISGAPTMINRQNVALTPGITGPASGPLATGAGMVGDLAHKAFISGLNYMQPAQARSKGGRIEAERLGKEADRANKSLGGALKPLMGWPDEDVVRALSIAKK